MAFFSIDETSGELLVGENFVLNAEYELYADRHDTYDLPIDGWYWFDTEKEARGFFGLPVAEDIVLPEGPEQARLGWVETEILAPPSANLRWLLD